MDKIIKDIVKVLDYASRYLPASEVDELEVKLLDGAWKSMYKNIECDFIVLKDKVKNRETV